MALQLALAPAIGLFGPELAVSTAIGIGLFFVPLWGLHRTMLASKDERQSEVRGRLLRLAFHRRGRVGLASERDRPGGSTSAGQRGEVRDGLARAAEVLTLEAAGRKVDASATWPFDLGTLRQLEGAVMLPIIIALLTELVRRLLGL